MIIKQVSVIFVVVLLIACNARKSNVENSYKLDNKLTKLAEYDEGYPLADEAIDTNAPYLAEEYIKYYHDFYKDKTDPPPFDFKVDLSKKSFQELRELRAEILARHGFLFMDYVFRSKFNSTNWYKPVFWYDNFQIKLNNQEEKFIDKILTFEKELYKSNFIKENAQLKANIDNVVNLQQFAEIDPAIIEHLRNDGFVINKADHYQLFHVYDRNYYDYTPSFITTDLYLQVLHMHISKEMQLIEEEKMIPLLSGFFAEQSKTIEEIIKTTTDPTVKKAAEWSDTYYTIALSLLNNNIYQVPDSYTSLYETELLRIKNAEGRKSLFLGDSLLDYTQFRPRGNYTRTDSLKNYFRCVKWLNSASIFADEDEGLSRSVLMAYAIMKSENSRKKYLDYSNLINFLAGEENNLSLILMMEVLRNHKTGNISEMLTPDKLNEIRGALFAKDPRKFQNKGINERTQEFIERKKVLFTAGRYTFDAEILQRLVHVTDPKPRRPFPKGLDVLAATGNNAAEDILLNVYSEKHNWEGYPDTLNVLKQKFRNFSNWNSSMYNKQMETILTLQNKNNNSPYFMQMPSWQLKSLNTMLASWAELKHDMILYIEQPSAAEMGDGGEIPPPQKIAYVEPQIDFWAKSIEMLELNDKFLSDLGFMSEKLKYRNNELIKIAQLLLNTSQKEIKGEYLTNEEFNDLSFLGGRIEHLTLNIIESDKMSVYEVATPEKYMAVAADVYTYKDQCLEECVGMGDEIYVVVEINGLLYIARGGVFSHYEFIQPASDRLTDEKWQQLLLEDKIPPVAPWLSKIKINVDKLTTQPNFNLY